jgi:hypothetical protein
MDSHDRYKLNKHLKAAAAIIFKNTPEDKLQDFESLELALRDQLQANVQPANYLSRCMEKNNAKIQILAIKAA